VVSVEGIRGAPPGSDPARANASASAANSPRIPKLCPPFLCETFELGDVCPPENSRAVSRDGSRGTADERSIRRRHATSCHRIADPSAP